jgi:hypothetical protein
MFALGDHAVLRSAFARSGFRDVAVEMSFSSRLTRPFVTLQVSRRLSCEENDDEDPTPRIIRCGNHCHQGSALLQYGRQGLPDGHQQL